METVAATGFEVIAEGFDFIEAPRVAPEGDVWFSDLTGLGVYRKRAGHPVETMLPGRQWVGGMVFDESGQVLCGGRGGIIALDPRTGRTTPVLAELEGQPIIAVNDMEADGRGGLYAGTIDFVSIMEKGEAPAPGTFFHMAADGRITVLRRDVFASNGIAFSPCGRWLYHSETTQGIWRYALDEAGVPALPGELLVREEEADGLATDSEGGLWLACWNSGRLVRHAADGTVLQTLTFPYPHIVSIAFGAADPHALYIATGGNAEVPAAGAVLRLTVEVAGLPGARSRLEALVAAA